MSRSFKHTPIIKDSTRKGATFKSGKQIANRTVRRRLDVPSGAAYKKIFCSYNISDYMFRMEERELKDDWNSRDPILTKRFRSYEDAKNWWRKYYFSK